MKTRGKRAEVRSYFIISFCLSLAFPLTPLVLCNRLVCMINFLFTLLVFRILIYSTRLPIDFFSALLIIFT